MRIKSLLDATGYDVADYPALKLHIPANAITEAGVATDQVTGEEIALGSSVNLSIVENGARFLQNGGLAAVSLPAPIVIGESFALLCCVSRNSVGSNIQVGAAEANRLQISAALRVSDGTNTTEISGAPSTSESTGKFLAFRSGTANEGTFYETALTTASYLAPKVASGTPGDVIDIGTVSVVILGSGFGNLDFYDAKLFVFESGEPSDLKKGIAWMTARALVGDYRPYPAWADKA